MATKPLLPSSAALAGALALCVGASSAQAALLDRGNGMVYDDVLKITWLQNANLAAGSSFDDGDNATDGAMSWSSASAWVSSLVYGGQSGWRLPTVVVGTDDGSCDFGYAGTDCGYNVSTAHSELAYMYTVNLGNQSVLDANGNPRASYGLLNTGPFTGLKAAQYWSGTTFEPNPDRAWNFDMNYGYQTYDFEDRIFYGAWAVHDGDVAAVPEPETWAMMFGGLAMLGWARRKAVRAGRR